PRETKKDNVETDPQTPKQPKKLKASNRKQQAIDDEDELGSDGEVLAPYVSPTVRLRQRSTRKAATSTRRYKDMTDSQINRDVDVDIDIDTDVDIKSKIQDDEPIKSNSKSKSKSANKSKSKSIKKDKGKSKGKDKTKKLNERKNKKRDVSKMHESDVLMEDVKMNEKAEEEEEEENATDKRTQKKEKRRSSPPRKKIKKMHCLYETLKKKQLKIDRVDFVVCLFLYVFFPQRFAEIVIFFFEIVKNKNISEEGEEDTKKSDSDEDDNKSGSVWKEDLSYCVTWLNQMDCNVGYKMIDHIKDISYYTVVVSQGGARTMKVLAGMARGAFIVCPKWIKQSFQSGKWLPPNEFQWDHFLMPEQSDTQLKSRLLALVDICGGVCVEGNRDYDYIISEKEIESDLGQKRKETKPVVSTQWLFENLVKKKIVGVFFVAIGADLKNANTSSMIAVVFVVMTTFSRKIEVDQIYILNKSKITL
ncbi:hypothetical protein RFI_11599, partial [Reticulomyxa filosa]